LAGAVRSSATLSDLSAEAAPAPHGDDARPHQVWGDLKKTPTRTRKRVIKLGDNTREAILAVTRFVAQSSGIEPTQAEIAAALRSYFTLNEVTNQIRYLRKKPLEETAAPHPGGPPRPRHRINLAACTLRSGLARAGYFIEEIGAGMAAIRNHAAAVLGAAPSEQEIARSLKSSFILSELKNQIVYARNRRPA
jgi:hypothetical protein